MVDYLDENGRGVEAVRVLPVTGQNIPVSGPLTDTQLRAVAVPVSSSFNVPTAQEDAQTATGAAAAITATLAAVAGKRTFISGFTVDGLGATGASVIEVTVTGVLGGTLRRKVNIPVGATVTITPLVVEFDRPIPASADNTAIVVNVPSFGTGNTDAIASVHGFNR